MIVNPEQEMADLEEVVAGIVVFREQVHRLLAREIEVVTQ